MEFITYKDYIRYLENCKNIQLREDNQNYKIQEEEQYYNKKLVQKMDKAHDKMFRKVLSIKKETTDFLNEFISLNKKIQENEIIQCKTDFITRNYKNRQADIIYKLREKPIYFLIEHQSTINKDMILRMWEYVGEIMKQESIIQKVYFDEESKYPIVIPIVIYTGIQKWNSKTSLIQKQYDSIEFDDYKIDFKYNLITIHNYSFEELLKKKSLFGCIMIIEKCNTENEIEKYMNKIIEFMKNQERKDILAEIISNIIEPIIGEEKTEEMLNKLYRKEICGMSPFTKTLLDMKNKYETKGMQKGIQEGKREGKKEGILNIAKRMIEKNIETEEIKELTGLSNEEILKLVKS